MARFTGFYVLSESGEKNDEYVLFGTMSLLIILKLYRFQQIVSEKVCNELMLYK